MMIIKPKTRGFICTTAHPTGCAHQVKEQIHYVQSQPSVNGPKKVLVIGSSMGFGLASRITAAFGSNADTIGVAYDRPASGRRTASAGWYHTAAFESEAKAAGLVAETIIGDAFSDEIKQATVERIKEKLGQVDLVIYSLASPKRVHPKTGETFSSVIKPIGTEYTNKTVDMHTGEVTDVTVQSATEEEVDHTIAVMGGEDWDLWMQVLEQAGVLADGVKTVAYSYIGPELTYPIYREGTIGKAKDHLEKTAKQLNEQLQSKGGGAWISVNKALVTQSSAAIPVVPLYISLLYKVMKEQGLHEGCIEQMYRLFSERLYAENGVVTDQQGRIRIDDWEMRDDVQQLVKQRWAEINTESIAELTDIEGYRADFFKIFGFDIDDIDYEQAVDPNVQL